MITERVSEVRRTGRTASLLLPTYRVCGVEMKAVDMATAVDALVVDAVARAGGHSHLCNAYTLSLVDADARLRASLQGGCNLPDGVPVARAGRSLGVQGPVRGPQLVRALCAAGVDHGLRHYFYGGGDGVVELMAERLQQEIPGLQVAGMQTPPFHDVTPQEAVDLAHVLRETGTHVLWVGLGTPRQDYAVAELSRMTNVVCIPVGAAFNFIAGTVQEAPRYLHGSGLEWLYRLVREPRFLWRRYLIGNPRFLRSAWRHRNDA